MNIYNKNYFIHEQLHVIRKYNIYFKMDATNVLLIISITTQVDKCCWVSVLNYMKTDRFSI